MLLLITSYTCYLLGEEGKLNTNQFCCIVVFVLPSYLHPFLGEFKTRPSEHHLKLHKSSMLDTLSEMLSFHRDLKNQHDPKKRPTTDELYYALLALKIKNIRTETDKFELEINKLKMELNAMNMDLHPRSKIEAGSDIKSIPAAKQKINEMSTHLPFGNAKNTTASTEI